MKHEILYVSLQYKIEVLTIKTKEFMKKINLFKSVLMMAVMMTFSQTMMSCGGDDEEDTPGGNTSIGVHRIDVQFSENTIGWDRQCAFFGNTPSGGYCTIYENNVKLSPEAGQIAWFTTDQRDLSIYTADGAAALTGNVMLLAPGNGADKDATVTMVGYVNNKRIYTRVFTLPAGKRSMSVSFTTDGGGTSGGSIDGEVSIN